MLKKRLIIMRHGDALPPRSSHSDQKRPLSPLGFTQVARVAQKIITKGWQPELILASPADRTYQSAEQVKNTLGSSGLVIEKVESFYLAGYQQIEDALITRTEQLTSVMLLGHNPGWADAIFQITGQFHQLSTACAALLELDGVDWLAALNNRGGAKFVEMLTP